MPVILLAQRIHQCFSCCCLHSSRCKFKKCPTRTVWGLQQKKQPHSIFIAAGDFNQIDLICFQAATKPSPVNMWPYLRCLINLKTPKPSVCMWYECTEQYPWAENRSREGAFLLREHTEQYLWAEKYRHEGGFMLWGYKCGPARTGLWQAQASGWYIPSFE